MSDHQEGADPDMEMRSRVSVNGWETTESVTQGHPDKVMDQIADAILDAALAQDPLSRVAVDGAGGRDQIFITAEMKTKAQLDIPTIVNEVYRGIGYTNELNVIVNLADQSGDIAGGGIDDQESTTSGVNANEDGQEGAGDQGIMIGYATRETPEMMPLTYALARRMTNRLTELVGTDPMPYVLPDGKSQVTVHDGKITCVVIACHHLPGVERGQLKEDVRQYVVNHVVDSVDRVIFSPDVEIRVNNTGAFEIGGLIADSGEVGRKIVSDAYGPRIPVGGGAFSGKDPTKVDRTGAYMCRFVAKSLLAIHEDEYEMLVRIAYAIGGRQPDMISAIGGSGRDYSEEVEKGYDFNVSKMIERFSLRQPEGWSYRQVAAAGHFGNPIFPWEKVQ